MSEVKELTMDAYYYRFDKTGVFAVDKILSAVARAGKAYHNTSEWNDEVYGGETPVQWIQDAANKCAADIARAREEGRREAIKEAYRGIFPFGDEADTVSTLLVRNILESVAPGAIDAILPAKGEVWPS